MKWMILCSCIVLVVRANSLANGYGNVGNNNGVNNGNYNENCPDCGTGNGNYNVGNNNGNGNGNNNIGDIEDALRSSGYRGRPGNRHVNSGDHSSSSGTRNINSNSVSHVSGFNTHGSDPLRPDNDVLELIRSIGSGRPNKPGAPDSHNHNGDNSRHVDQPRTTTTRRPRTTTRPTTTARPKTRRTMRPTTRRTTTTQRTTTTEQRFRHQNTNNIDRGEDCDHGKNNGCGNNGVNNGVGNEGKRNGNGNNGDNNGNGNGVGSSQSGGSNNGNGNEKKFVLNKVDHRVAKPTHSTGEWVGHCKSGTSTYFTIIPGTNCKYDWRSASKAPQPGDKLKQESCADTLGFDLTICGCNYLRAMNVDTCRS